MTTSLTPSPDAGQHTQSEIDQLQQLSVSLHRLAADILEQAAQTSRQISPEEAKKLRQIVQWAHAFAYLAESGDVIRYLQEWHDWARDLMLVYTKT